MMLCGFRGRHTTRAPVGIEERTQQLRPASDSSPRRRAGAWRRCPGGAAGGRGTERRPALHVLAGTTHVVQHTAGGRLSGAGCERPAMGRGDDVIDLTQEEEPPQEERQPRERRSRGPSRGARGRGGAAPAAPGAAPGRAQAHTSAATAAAAWAGQPLGDLAAPAAAEAAAAAAAEGAPKRRRGGSGGASGSGSGGASGGPSQKKAKKEKREDELGNTVSWRPKAAQGVLLRIQRAQGGHRLMLREFFFVFLSSLFARLCADACPQPKRSCLLQYHGSSCRVHFLILATRPFPHLPAAALPTPQWRASRCARWVPRAARPRSLPSMAPLAMPTP